MNTDHVHARFWLAGAVIFLVIGRLLTGDIAGALSAEEYVFINTLTRIEGTSDQPPMAIDFPTYAFRQADGTLQSQDPFELTTATKVIAGGGVSLGGSVGMGAATGLRSYVELAIDGLFSVATDGSIRYFYGDEWISLQPGEQWSKTIQTTAYEGFTGQLIVTFSVTNYGVQSKAKITAPQAPADSVGDADENGLVTILDALLVARYAVGLDTVMPNPVRGDVDYNGMVNIVDALQIAQSAAGLLRSFPRSLITDWSKGMGVSLQGYTINPVNHPVLSLLFPGYTFYSIIHIRYPVAQIQDSILKENSLIAIKDYVVTDFIQGTARLQDFFNTRLVGPNDFTIPYAQIMQAWLAFSQELKDDGFYTFTIPPEQITITLLSATTDPRQPRYKVEGVSQVTAGGSGGIYAALYFNDGAVLLSFEEVNELIPGVRPICQSSKLLDPDPIVRKMAEKDLLIMGKNAWPYLCAQREKAAPEIRLAIDRIWKQILENEQKLEQWRNAYMKKQ